MYLCGMKQKGERHVANQVDLMVWSDRLDLLALSNVKGDVQIHRLEWQKVWSLPPPKENDIVKAMTWRPDGKALAIGYGSGSVYIVDIEDKEVIDKFFLEEQASEEFEDSKLLGISCMIWPVISSKFTCSTDDTDFYNDSTIYLTKPPTTFGYKNQTSDDNTKHLKEYQEQTQLNILFVGYGDGHINMRIFGRFPFGALNISEIIGDETRKYQVLDMHLTEDFSAMHILYYSRDNSSMYVAILNTNVLTTHAEEAVKVANKHSQIVQLMLHLDQTMVSINEAWEHILLEMDTKMADYAASVPDGGVSADFLELLLMGVPSDELELFLLQELTAKGLKKFGTSVELSYSTIQKLVLKQLNVVGQSLIYHLSELRGLTRVPDRYKIMGLSESNVTEAIKASFAFLNKCLELQQVIDVSMRNYKTFFRWLFVVIVRLLDEQTPSEIVKITQQDLAHIAEFLYNFDNIKPDSDKSNEKPARFNLERLGQYLQNQDLTMFPDDEDNPWYKFLNENPCLQEDSEILLPISQYKKYSLVQQQQHLKKSLHKVFDVVDKDDGRDFLLTHNFRFCEDSSGGVPKENFRFSLLHDPNQDRFMVAMINRRNSKEGLCFMCVSGDNNTCKAIKYYFSPTLFDTSYDEKLNGEPIAVLDLKFYSSTYLSVLTSHPHEDSSIFIQVPLTIVIDNANDVNIKSKSCIFGEKLSRRDLSPLLDQGVLKVLEKMDGYEIAVSGVRKVAVILSKTRRKVRVFEMEVDDDDDEDNTTSSSLNSTVKNEDDSHTSDIERTLMNADLN